MQKKYIAAGVAGLATHFFVKKGHIWTIAVSVLVLFFFDKVAAKAKEAPKKGNSASTSTPVKVGRDVNQTVITIQKLLNQHFHAGLVEDGVRGAKTNEAISAALPLFPTETKSDSQVLAALYSKMRVDEVHSTSIFTSNFAL